MKTICFHPVQSCNPVALQNPSETEQQTGWAGLDRITFPRRRHCSPRKRLGTLVRRVGGHARNAACQVAQVRGHLAQLVRGAFELSERPRLV